MKAGTLNRNHPSAQEAHPRATNEDLAEGEMLKEGELGKPLQAAVKRTSISAPNAGYGVTQHHPKKIR